MAKAIPTEKVGIVEMDLPECPICNKVYTAPIYNCQSGHSLCADCNASLLTAFCPMCRQPMTQMRNRELEKFISKLKVHCPNKVRGCIYTMMSQEVNEHTKECIFRDVTCPLGAVFGKCSWNGIFKDVMSHCKERHPENCNVSNNSEVELDNVSTKADDRHVFLVTQNKNLFIITLKIDTICKMVYWIVQRIGSQKIAQEHVYEIHIVSKQDDRRKVAFHEYCRSEDTRPEEIFREGKCAVMPFSMFNHFIADNKLAFKFFIKTIVHSKHNYENAGHSRAHSKGPNDSRSSRSPGPRGHGVRGHKPRGRPHNRGSSYGGHRQVPNPIESDGPKGKSNFNHPFDFSDKEF